MVLANAVGKGCSDARVMGGILENQDALVEAVGVGTGALLVHRSVFETLRPPWFKFTYRDNGTKAQGEDFYFSKKARKAGFRLWVDTTRPCGHVHLADIREECAQLQLALDSKTTEEFEDRMGFPKPVRLGKGKSTR